MGIRIGGMHVIAVVFVVFTSQSQSVIQFSSKNLCCLYCNGIFPYRWGDMVCRWLNILQYSGARNDNKYSQNAGIYRTCSFCGDVLLLMNTNASYNCSIFIYTSMSYVCLCVYVYVNACLFILASVDNRSDKTINNTNGIETTFKSL